jgi:hypothetical protein
MQPGWIAALVRRLPLAGLILAALLALTTVLAIPRTLTVDVGGALDTRFLSGFLPAIVGERTTYRWSGPEAQIHLHGFTCDSCVVTLRVDAGNASPPRRLRLVRLQGPRGSEADLASCLVTPGWQTQHLTLENARLDLRGLGAPALLGIRADGYRRDADGNDLGFKIDSLQIEPISRPLRDPLLFALLWTIPLAVAALLVRRLLTLCGPRLSSRARALAGLLFAIAVLLLSAAAHARPFATAWAFPPMPIVSASIGALLAWPALRRLLAPATGAVRDWRRRGLVRWTALTLALAALTLFSLGRGGMAAGLVLIVGLLLALLAGLTPEPDDAHRQPSSLAPIVAALALILLVGLVLRFYRITELPYGLWRDEARHGLAALRIIEDPAYRPVFVPEADIPAAGIYAFVPGLALLGIAPWTLRVTTAVAGFLTLIPFALLARRLTRRIDTALVATGLLAASAWHLHLSRLAFTVVFEPLCEVTGLLLLLGGLRPGLRTVRRVLWLAGAGIALALAVQTYHAGRVVLATAPLAVLLFRPEGERLRRTLARITPALALFLLAVAPIAAYSWTHSREVNARVGQAFLLSHARDNGVAPLAALDDSIGRHLVMLHVRGDSLGRHNLPGRPQLEPLAGLGFLVGLAVLLRRRDLLSLFLLTACALAAVPSLLSVDGPRATRAVALLPYATLVAAQGWEALCAPFRRRQWLPLVLTLASVPLAAWSYFVAAPSNEAVWRSFYPVETQVGAHLRHLADHEGALASEKVYLPADLGGNEAIRYLAHGLRFGVYDPDEMWPRPGASGALILPEGRDASAAAALILRHGRRPRPPEPGPALPDGRPAFQLLSWD